MTKQEIEEKIRYNENLVYQYQRELRTLENRLRSLNSRNYQLGQQLTSLSSMKRTLEGEVGELQGLKMKFQNLRNDFSSRQSKRMSSFNNGIAQILNFKFIASYISGMRELLSGQEYRNTYNGIGAALEKVCSKIQAKQRELESLMGEYNNTRRNIDNTQTDIKTCRNNICQKRNDLSYRKSRVRYWEDQLQSAT